ncbi:MAG: hypothetical protein RQ847_11735, partial [Wenzhouxiangellaceae bacterium]|nr:hypothetical protein [Wenzhouxiangellaceae bacterium]
MTAGDAAPVTPGALWVADRDGIAVLDSTGEVLLEIATDRPVRATAFDRARDTVWVLDDRGELSAFDLEGMKLGSVEVPSSPPSPSSPPANRDPELVIDSPAATLWLLAGNTLYRFDAQGDFQQALDLDPAERLQGLALDEARSRLWLANARSLKAFDPSGANTHTIEVDLPSPGIEATAFDPFLDALWVAGGGRVQRYDGEGQPVFEAEAGREIKHIAADGRGGAWLAGPERLEH